MLKNGVQHYMTLHNITLYDMHPPPSFLKPGQPGKPIFKKLYSLLPMKFLSYQNDIIIIILDLR